MPYPVYDILFQNFIAAFRVRQLQPGAGDPELLRARGEALLRGLQPGMDSSVDRVCLI